MVGSEAKMKGKVCLVTGATSGIGLVTALELALMGSTLIITARNEQKADAAVERIVRETGNTAVESIVADLSSQAQVRSLVVEFEKRFKRLDVLVNNAGAVYLRRKLSPDGIEMTFAVNHLAPFLLTNLLLDTILASAPARIINVSSRSHERAEVDFADLEGKKSYNFNRAYRQSKLANVMFTYELAHRLAGSGVTVNALHPGFVGTNMGANNGWLVRLFLPLTRIWAISPQEGAETSVYLATSPDVEGVSGEYFYQGEVVTSSLTSHDQETARRLWEVSAEMTGLSTTIT